MHFRHQDAGVLALGLRSRLVDHGIIARWAAAQLDVSNDDRLVELAGLYRPSDLDVLEILESLARDADGAEVFRTLLGFLRNILSDAPSRLGPILLALEALAYDHRVPEPYDTDCMWFGDEYALARDGINSTVEEVANKFQLFLVANAMPCPLEESRAPSA